MAIEHRSEGAKRHRGALATLLAAAAVALTWVIVGVTGSAGSYAAWSAAATLPAVNLQTGTAALQLNDFDLTHTFSAESTSAWKVATIRNTGTAPLRHFVGSASLATGASSALANAVKLTIWPVANGTTSCESVPTAPAPTVGSWGAFPAWLGQQISLGAMNSATDTVSYCILSSISTADLAATAGTSASLSVTVTGTTGADGSGWSTSASKSLALSNSTPLSTSGAIVNNSGTNLAVTRTTAADGSTCFAMHVTAAGNSKTQWQLTIYTKNPAFLDAPVSSWTWSPSTSVFDVVSGPDGQGVLVIDGVGGTTGSNGTGNDKFVEPEAPFDLTFCVKSTS